MLSEHPLRGRGVRTEATASHATRRKWCHQQTSGAVTLPWRMPLMPTVPLPWHPSHLFHRHVSSVGARPRPVTTQP